MQSSREGRPAGGKKENQKKKMVKAAPAPVADAEESNEHDETTSEASKPEARAASELVQHQRRALPEKKGIANGVMSAFGRRDPLTMVRRIEAARAEAQRAVDSTTAHVAKALDLVGGQWFQVERLLVSATDKLADLRVAVTDELADMRKTNEIFHAEMEAELADMRKRTRSSIAVMEAELAEAQCAAQRAQEALPGFRIALAAFMEQQARWFRCALTSDVPANESGPAAQERFRMERCWCAVEAAAANMGEDFSQFLPLMRQAIAQVELAVAPDDTLLERLEPLLPLEHSEAHTSGSGTESEGAGGRDRDSQPRENAGWEHAAWSRRCRWPARAERRSLRRRRWKRLMRALRGKG
jgi:hypothetical protein